MSNSDIVAIYRGRTFKYSSDNGLTWSTLTAISGVTGDLLAVTHSTSSQDVLYFLEERTVGTYPTNYNLHGGMLTYNTGTRTFTVTSGSTVLLTSTSSYVGQSHEILAMVSDGTRIHFIHRISTYQDTNTGKLFGALASTFGSAALDHDDEGQVIVKGSGNTTHYDPSYGLVLNAAGTGLLALATNIYYDDTPSAPAFSITEFSVGATTYTETNTTSIANAKNFVVARNNLGYADIVYLATTGVYATPVETRYVQRQSPTSITTAVSVGAGAVIPDLIGYLLDAGQYRLFFGALSSASLSLYRNVSTSWTYAGTIAVPYSNANGWTYSGRFECVKASSVANGAAAGIVVNIAYDVEVYSGYSITVSTAFGRLGINSAPTIAQTYPINGLETFDQTADNITLMWAYGDTDDAAVQTQYVAEVVENLAGATTKWVKADGTLDTVSTTVTSAAQSATINAGQLGASAYGYKWRVRASDVHGTFSTDTPYQTFRVAGRPTVTITSPVSLGGGANFLNNWTFTSAFSGSTTVQFGWSTNPYQDTSGASPHAFVFRGNVTGPNVEGAWGFDEVALTANRRVLVSGVARNPSSGGTPTGIIYLLSRRAGTPVGSWDYANLVGVEYLPDDGTWVPMSGQVTLPDDVVAAYVRIGGQSNPAVGAGWVQGIQWDDVHLEYVDSISDVTSNHPTFQWTYADPESTAMSASRVKIRDVLGSLLYDSGVVTNVVANGATASHKLSGYALPSNGSYTVGILCADSVGAWSSEAQRAFNYVAYSPSAPTINIVFTNGIAVVTVTESSALPAVASNDLYRWSPRLQKYVLVASGLGPSFVETDGGASPNTALTYKVVTYGDNDATTETISSPVSYADEDWRLVSGAGTMLIVPNKFTANPPRQQETLEPLGRTVPVVSEFELLGNEGEVVIDLDTSGRDADLASIEGMSGTTGPVYIKSPLGEVFNVTLGSYSVRMGIGGRAEVSIPYIEVADA